MSDGQKFVGILFVSLGLLAGFATVTHTRRTTAEKKDQLRRMQAAASQRRASETARRAAEGLANQETAQPSHPAPAAQQLARLRERNRAQQAELVRLRARLRALGDPGGAAPPPKKDTASEAPPATADLPAGTAAARIKSLFLAAFEKGSGLSAIRGSQYKQILGWVKANPEQAAKLLGPLILDQTQPATVRAGAALVFDAHPNIGGTGVRSVTAQLEQAATTDTDPIVRRSAVHALAFMEGDHVVGTLTRVVREANEEWGVKMNAAFGLARRGQDTGTDFLLEKVRDPKAAAMVRSTAAQSLFAARPKKALPYFYESLQASELGFRLGATRAIAEIVSRGDQTALGALRRAIERAGESSLVVTAAKKAYNKVAGAEVYPLD